MGKVIGFELKKLVSRIGTYILVVLLAGVLVAGVFMYKPTKRNTTPLSLVGDTVSEMYNNFNNDLKQGYVDNIENIAVNAETYIPTSNTYVKSNDVQYIKTLFTQFDDYCLLYKEAIATSSEHSSLLSGIKESLAKLNSTIDTGLEFSKKATGYYILTTNNNYSNLSYNLIKAKSNFEKTASTSPAIASETYFNELRTPLYDCLQNLIYPNLSKTAEKYAPNGTYYELITSRMNEIAIKMQQVKTKVDENADLESNNALKNELNTLFNRYANCAEIFNNAYNSEMCVEALNSVNSKTKRANLLGYADVSLYEQEEHSLLYQYYIEKHVSSYDYANNLSVTHTSNGEINAYDFTFFVMSIFAIAIMLFVIFLSAHTIAGEINNNTMRFTALRPIKRSSLFFGKFLAIMIMAFILLLFGTVTSLITGGILYGFESANILMIFNGNLILSVHPLIIISIFVLSLFLMSAVYSALTMCLSAIFKSELITMLIGIVLYSVNLILPLFFGIGSWLKFYPFANINLFAYFGNNRLSSNNVLAKLFNTVVYQGMNIWISLIYVFGITTILLLIGRHIFKKREL